MADNSPSRLSGGDPASRSFTPPAMPAMPSCIRADWIPASKSFSSHSATQILRPRFGKSCIISEAQDIARYSVEWLFYKFEPMPLDRVGHLNASSEMLSVFTYPIRVRENLGGVLMKNA